MKLLENVLDILFPPICLSCREYVERGSVMCGRCISSIETYSGFFCAKCKARLPNALMTCHKDEPCIFGAPLPYSSEPVQKMVKALKFEGVKDVAELLGKFIADHLKEYNIKDAVLIPIPLGKRRLRKRGYNQAELIALSVSVRLDLPMSNMLIRIKETEKQSDIQSEDERAKNVTGCFEALPGENMNQTFILIDDVTTSGSTLREAARALKRNGARKVLAIAASRA